jgi:hypothetical protein
LATVRDGDFFAALTTAFFEAVLAGRFAASVLGTSRFAVGRGVGRLTAGFFAAVGLFAAVGFCAAGDFFAPALRAASRVAVFFRFIMAGYLLVGSRTE